MSKTQRFCSGTAIACAALSLSACGILDSSSESTPTPMDGGDGPAIMQGPSEGNAEDDSGQNAGPDDSQGAGDSDSSQPVEEAGPYQVHADEYTEIAQRLSELPGDAEAVILENGEPVLEYGTGEAAPLASVFKLYVLLALLESIEAGQVDWHDQLTLTPELRSLPSGTLQDQPDGFDVMVLDAAQRMIAVSDNTGTDLFIDLLGREAIEEVIAEAGHHNPELMRPLLSTRDMFQLRWGVPELGEDWVELDHQQRRDRLDEVAEEDLEITSDDTRAEDLNFDIDWYATAEDIAQLHLQLHDMREEHEHLDLILGSDLGLVGAVEDPWWDTIAYKGGGLPGVLTGAWHAEDEDGNSRTVVVLLKTEDPDALAEQRPDFFSLTTEALILDTETEVIDESNEDDDSEDDDATEETME